MKIKNNASINFQACEEEIKIESNELETNPIKIRIEKKQDCDFVLIGENIKYTIEIENQCSTDLFDLVFKDRFDECTEFVEGSFRVNDHVEHPTLVDHELIFEIEKLEECEELTITFEVKTTDDCCHCTHPQPEQSEPPTIRHPNYNDNYVNGTGVPYATIEVEFPGGQIVSTTVNNGGNWRVDAPYRLQRGDTVYAIQIEPNKSPSIQVSATVPL